MARRARQALHDCLDALSRAISYLLQSIQPLGRLPRILAVSTVFLLTLVLLYPSYRRSGPVDGLNTAQEVNEKVNHPVDGLMRSADVRFAGLLSKETHGINAAAAMYRKSRGRHPPPGWARYVEWCEKNKALMIEDFYDPLYRDLAPFWSVSPEKMRTFPQQWPKTLSIRNGTMQRRAVGFLNLANWIGLWEAALDSLPAVDLPDIDLAFNMDDEPKLFPNYNLLHKAHLEAEADRIGSLDIPLDQIENGFTKLESFNEGLREESTTNHLFKWSDRPKDSPIWDLARAICPPDTPGKLAVTDTRYNSSAETYWTDMASARHLEGGFVRDWEASKSVCLNPALREIHGAYVGMKGYSIEKPKGHEDTRPLIEDLVPLLSGCKIKDVNADILLPPAVEFESSADAYIFDPHLTKPWAEKKGGTIWRGMASGGDHTVDNWTRFHRHRLVAMLNSTLVADHYKSSAAGHGVPLVVPGGEPPLPHNFPHCCR